ncbi:MAG TPA: winged helix-turn-helix transcriptional regulator [bacterium]|nr:winged helix-turn-helix transcriptional regulator [bacterium]
MLTDKELELINVLGRQPHTSQRSLANEVRISLGMVNLFVRKLTKKGLVTVQKINRRDLRYILTPAGLKARASYNLQYLDKRLTHFVRAKELVTEKLDEVLAGGFHSVYLMAKGEWSEIGFIAAKGMGIDLLGFVGTVPGSRVLGCPVYTIEEMLARPHAVDTCLLVLNGHNPSAQEKLAGRIAVRRA